MPYHVMIIGVFKQETLVVLDKDESWIEEHIASPRREGHDILFAGVVISWIYVDEIHITYTDQTSRQVSRTRPEPPSVIPYDTRSYDARSEPPSIIRDEESRYGLSPPLRYRPHRPPSPPPPPLSDLEVFDLLVGDDVTDRFISGAPGDPLLAQDLAEQQRPSPSNRQKPARAANRKAVMVIYGHDDEANSAIFSWLHDVGLQPKEWSQLIQLSDSTSPYIGDVLERTFQNVQAVVALFTPDERVRERRMQRTVNNPWRLQARPNVLIEAGMALVTHPDRTILVTLGPCELPSDLAGRSYIRLDGTPGPLSDLANRLRSAGCKTDQTGTRWLDPARFPNRDHTPASPPTA
jgi:predicted nucleotide-binding protein